MSHNRTQREIAQAGEISDAMKRIAEKEHIEVETIRRETAEGKLAIPANPRHTSLDPIGIGRCCTVKINANIGNSALDSDIENELKKLVACVRYGADTVMDLSTGGDLNEIRAAILAESPLPVGTVPIYEAIARVPKTEDLTAELLLDVIENQAKQGVDFMTVHAGLLRKHVPLAKKRLTGIVSRGGSLTAEWMSFHRRENPLYERYDDLLKIAREYDVTLSLGDGLRPGCLADAGDEAQFAELDVLGELTRRAWEAGVQVIVEGPGHVPFDQIESQMKRQQEVCSEAPFYVLGPIVTDIAPGYDHITSTIGATAAAFHGACYLCYVTPMEHLGLPDLEDVRNGIVAYKIAAHAADIAKGHPGARDRDDAMSHARQLFDWEKQFEISLDPDRARKMRMENLPENCPENGDYCTMCGPKFCAMRISKRIK